MSKQIEALKLALEALQNPWKAGPDGVADAIIAIKEALAQPEQEPVTWRYKIVDVFGRPAWTLKTPKSDTRVLESQPLYTTPPQRTWVGLTEDEAFACQGRDYFETYKAIEAKLKERNT